MHFQILYLITMVLLSCFAAAQNGKTDYPVLKGPYLGQKMPGRMPEVFAPGIVSGVNRPLHGPPAISPDGTEIYWSVTMPPEILYSKLENGSWTKPQPAPFSRALEAFCPVYSPDGSRLFFSTQTVENRNDPQKIKFILHLWCVERKNDGWTSPSAIDSVINDGTCDYFVSALNDGTLYFTRPVFTNGKETEEVFYSRLTNEKYSLPVNAGLPINDGGKIHHVFVAPDESYMLFSRYQRVQRPQGIYSDFYISLHNADGTWTEPEEIGDMLGEKSSSGFIGVSPDGKYIFFTSIFPGRMTNLYWRDSNLIQYFLKKTRK